MTKYNPFRPQGIVHPGMFSGRYEEISIIEKSLRQAKFGNPNHFLLEGERGIGKSSLFLFLQHLATGELFDEKDYNFVTAYVELNGSITFLDIIQRVQSAVKSELLKRNETLKKFKELWEFVKKWEVSGVKFEDRNDQADRYLLLQNLADSLQKILSDTKLEVDGILILIDEADKPSEDAALGEFIKLLTERLTFSGADNVLIGLAGLPTTVTKLKASHESSPRVFQILNLQPLSHDESKNVIISALKIAQEINGFEITATEDAIEMIVSLAEGYPHFIQQFAYSAFDADTDNHITVDDVKSGAFGDNGAMEQLGRKFFADMYFNKINSDEYRKVLNTMAQFADEWVSRSTIIEASGLSEHTIGNAIKALKERGIILSNEATRGIYKLPTKSFATWINAYQSLNSR